MIWGWHDGYWCVWVNNERHDINVKVVYEGGHLIAGREDEGEGKDLRYRDI